MFTERLNILLQSSLKFDRANLYCTSKIKELIITYSQRVKSKLPLKVEIVRANNH